MTHACAVDVVGAMQCWGDDTYGQTSGPSGVVTSMSAGGYDTLVVREDGTLAMWGGVSQAAGPPPEGEFSQVSAGFAHACALDAEHRIRCWGNVPHDLAPLGDGLFTAVATGDFQACGLKTNGELVCVGGEAWLDDGEVGESGGPPGTFASLDVAETHACAVDLDGRIRCWGDDGSGQCSPP